MLDWITVLAIIVGPILAVIVTRWIDQARERHKRRMEIFRTLMRTRRAPTSSDHVGALNLIEIEFHKDPEVLAAWKLLFQHLGQEPPRRANEIIGRDDSPEAVQQKEQAFGRRLSDERQRLLAKLLHAMASKLNFSIEQLEIFEGGYLPQGPVDIETEQSLIRRFLISLAAGRAFLPVAVLSYSEHSKEPDQVEEMPAKSHK